MRALGFQLQVLIIELVFVRFVPRIIPAASSLISHVVSQLNLPLTKRFHITHDCPGDNYLLGFFAFRYFFFGELDFEKFFGIGNLIVKLE